jgi:predicted dehydrogenase
VKFMIAGLGSIGRRHLRNLRALGEEDILLYRTHQSTLSDDDLAGLPAESDLSAALALGPQAVIVANPTALHLDVAMPAAQAGCGLFLEKPVSNSMARLDELAALVAHSGQPAMVGFQFRFHPGLIKARELIQSGAIGRPLTARAHWGEYLPGWHPWEDYRLSYSARSDLGGGVVFTLSHPLDYLRWMLGEVEAVFAITGRLGDLDLQVEDTAEISLRFASGALGSLHLDYTQRPTEHRLQVIGSQGTLEWDNADGAVRLFRADQAGPQVFPAPQGFERNDMFLAEMRNFIDALHGRIAPDCTLADGARALELALAVHRSAQSGYLVKL